MINIGFARQESPLSQIENVCKRFGEVQFKCDVEFLEHLSDKVKKEELRNRKRLEKLIKGYLDGYNPKRIEREDS